MAQPPLPLSGGHILENKKIGTKSGRRPTFAFRLSLALMGLTAVFGMGTGVPPPLQAPRFYTYFYLAN